MPKINNTHKSSRIQEHIAKIERGEEVEAKKDKTLLTEEQQQALTDALAHQKQLKKTHKRPKTQSDKDAIGWKEIREVRLEIYREALNDLQDSAVDDFKELLHKEKVRSARVFMDAWSKAGKEGKTQWQAVSAGNIALTRAGLGKPKPSGLAKRDKEIRDMEEAILKQAKVTKTGKKKTK
jgi:hypothetical protein